MGRGELVKRKELVFYRGRKRGEWETRKGEMGKESLAILQFAWLSEPGCLHLNLFVKAGGSFVSDNIINASKFCE